MAGFRDSRTARNLLVSYSAEAQARTRYDIFASRAREDGFWQIAALFEETARQEYEHAIRFFKFFNGGDLEICGTFPAGVERDTRANLLASAELELYVHGTLYSSFAVIAREEGFDRAAETFDAISVAERHHEEMFRQLAKNIDSGAVFSRREPQVWKCLNCGYLHIGETPPDKCPACVKPRGCFEILARNW